MMKLIKLLGLVFLACVFYSLGKRAEHIGPPPEPLTVEALEQWPEASTVTLPSTAFGYSQPSQIQTQQQTVNVYPPNYTSPDWITSPSVGLALRNLGTNRPPPIRRTHQ